MKSGAMVATTTAGRVLAARNTWAVYLSTCRSNAARAMLRNGCDNLGAQRLWRPSMRTGNGWRSLRSASSRVGTQKQAGTVCRQGKKIPLTVLQAVRSRLLHTTRASRVQTPNPTSNLGSSANETLTLSQRMRKLSREYGWSALGVYLVLTALDLPLCYLLVRYLGTDRIGEWEHIIVSGIQRLIPQNVKSTWHEWIVSIKQVDQEAPDGEAVADHVEMAGWGVEEAQERNKQDASLATQLALAYAIHKSFIFIRVPLTAALTPKVVRVLRGWGWDIGKKITREARAISRTSRP